MYAIRRRQGAANARKQARLGDQNSRASAVGHRVGWRSMASVQPGNEIAPSGGRYYTGATGSAVSSVRGKIATTSLGGTSDDDHVC